MLRDDQRRSCGDLLAPTSWGNLIDRITILEIKHERIGDKKAAANITRELDALCAIRDRCLPAAADIGHLVEELSQSNRSLWGSEVAIRRLELGRDFGPEFVAVARAIHKENDRRSRIKRAIDLALGNQSGEIKIYDED